MAASVDMYHLETSVQNQPPSIFFVYCLFLFLCPCVSSFVCVIRLLHPYMLMMAR